MSFIPQSQHIKTNLRDKMSKAVLEVARGIISDGSRWCRGAMARNDVGDAVQPLSQDACRWCAAGAVEFAADQICTLYGIPPGVGRDDMRHDAVVTLDRAVRSRNNPKDHWYDNVTVFNDQGGKFLEDPKKHHKRVLDFFDVVIESL